MWIHACIFFMIPALKVTVRKFFASPGPNILILYLFLVLHDLLHESQIHLPHCVKYISFFFLYISPQIWKVNSYTKLTHAPKFFCTLLAASLVFLLVSQPVISHLKLHRTLFISISSMTSHPFSLIFQSF